MHGPEGAADTYADFSIGWAVAGALNILIGAVQIFAPDWPDGDRRHSASSAGLDG